MYPKAPLEAVHPNRPCMLGRILAVIVLAYSALATFAVPFQPIAAGLDPSWMYGLNRVANSSYVFGRDLAFTYGPLGFLMNPMDVGSCLAIAIIFWAGLQFCLFASVGWRLRNHPGRLAAFCGFYVLLTAFGLWPEHRVFGFLAVLVLSTFEAAGSVWIAWLAGLCCVFGLETKWSIGASAFSLLGASWIALIVRREKSAPRTIIGGILGVFAAIVASLTFFFHSVSNLGRWVWLSMNLADGYSSNMSLDGPGGVRLLAGLDAGIVLVVFFIQPKSIRPLAALLLAGPIAIAFKEGFVRQDGHSFAYFAVVTFSLAMLLFLPESWRLSVPRLAAGMAATFSVGLVYACNYPAFPALVWSEFRDLLFLRVVSVQVSHMVHFGANRRHLQAIAHEALEGSVLPAAWRARIAAPRARTSILPWELSIAAANPMQWQPLPTFQLYTAYTPALDSETATHLRQNGADFLIASFEDIDGRNLMLDVPKTWRQILSRYEVSDSDLSHRRMLLSRTEARYEALTEMSSGSTSLDGWIAVPRTAKLVFADLDLPTNLFGSLRNLFYQLPAVYLETQRESGRVDRYRLVTRNAVNGILANYLPVDQAAFDELFRGYADDPVIRLRVLSTAGGRYLRSHFCWRFLESDFKVRTRSEITAPPLITRVFASSGQGENSLINVTASDPNGSRYIQYLQILVSTELDGANACYISYQTGENLVSLIANAGSGAAGMGTPGYPKVLENSQCSVGLREAEAHFEGNQINLRVPVTFRASFKGLKQIRAYAVDRRARHSEWTLGGDWEIR